MPGQSIWDWWTLPDDRGPALHRLCPRQCLDRHQRHGAQQRQRQGRQPDARPISPRPRRWPMCSGPMASRSICRRASRAPIEIGGLKTADPLDPAVARLVEGQGRRDLPRHPRLRRLPGQGQFARASRARRTTAAPMPTAPTCWPTRSAPHGGIVMWRAFVYSDDGSGRTAPSRPMPSSSRSTASSRDNVIVQVKNGAIDFQPREPFHPLFGAMPKTPLMMEFQITKEYLGFATHLAYLGPLFEEALRGRHLRARGGLDRRQGRRRRSDGARADRHGRRRQHRHATATGPARIFDQANWYVFGRLAWDPEACRARRSRAEWARHDLRQRSRGGRRRSSR